MSSITDTCCICLEIIVPEKLPIELECKHKFCFLCIKGVYERDPACPLCRHAISDSIIQSAKITLLPKRDIYWFYAGRNGGWWMYDPTTTEQIEKEYQRYQENSEKSEDSEKNSENSKNSAEPGDSDESEELDDSEENSDVNRSECKLSILGRDYTIDFVNMEQKGNLSKRKIKRELGVDSIDTKGIAGLKIDKSSVP